MDMKTLKIVALMFLVLLTSCVSQKKYSDLENQSQRYENNLKLCENEKMISETNLANEKNKVHKLESQLDYFKSTNTNLLERLSDLFVVSKTGAESIKKSLEALNEQNVYIKNLTTSMQKKDSLNLVLVMNLKSSLADFDDEDIAMLNDMAKRLDEMGGEDVVGAPSTYKEGDIVIAEPSPDVTPYKRPIKGTN